MNVDATASRYILGHSSPELARLRRQAAVYAEFTQDVLRQAGLATGMSVLDVGCGVGDVSLAAARLVGPEGRVRGIDRSLAALDVGRTRIAGEGLTWIGFDQVDIDDVADGPYDAVIGRFILLHRPDPVETLRHLTGLLRPGGIAAFIEMDLSTADVVPPMPLFAEALEWIRQVYVRDGFHTDMGSKLFAAFHEAGLDPELRASVRVEGGPDAYAYDYVAETVRSLMPRIEALGIAAADEIGIDSLADRIRSAALEGSHCFFYPRMVGAYVRRPA